MQCAVQSRARGAGFTLLEVMLALALSAVLLGAVGVAVQMHMRAVEAGRVEIEQAQIARAVLDRIADDLRGALQHTTVDTSQLKVMATAAAAMKGNTDAIASAVGAAGGSTSGGSAATSSGGSSNSSSGGSSSRGNSSTSVQQLGQTSSSSSGSKGTSGSSTKGSSGTSGGSSANTSGGSNSSSGGSSNSSNSGNSGNSTSSPSSSSQSGDSTSLTEPPPPPGIYGTDYQVQVDVSRLPRPDEYASAFAGGVASNAAGAALAASVPHDVRTVTYYLNSQAQAASNLAGAGGGLMRREQHRSAALWESQQGLDGTPDMHDVSLAPEVTKLEFRYLDGTEWVTEWDMSSAGYLPTAIEIAVTIGMPIDPTASNASLNSLVSPSTPAASELVVRRVVYLPGAGPPSSAAATGSGSSSSTSGSSSTSSPSSASGS